MNGFAKVFYAINFWGATVVLAGWLARLKSLNRIVIIAFSVYHVTTDYSRQVPSVSSGNVFNPIINSYSYNAQCQHEAVSLFNISESSSSFRTVVLEVKL